MKKIIFSMAVFAIVSSSCKKEESNKSGKVDISFNHKVGNQALTFDEKKYATTQGHLYEVRTLKYFVSNLTFTKSDGSIITVDQPIYVDAEDPTFTSKSNIVELDEGLYTSVALTFGIDSTANISNSLTTTEEANMAWPEGMMGGGYHYMKLEGTYDSLGVDTINNAFNVHTGGTMGGDYSFNVLFPNSAFTLDEDGINLEVTMDVSEWFVNPSNYDFATYGPAIMMNMMAQKELQANGNSVLSVSVK